MPERVRNTLHRFKKEKKASSMQTDTTTATPWRRNYSQALLKLFTLTRRQCLARTETVVRFIESGSDETFHCETKARGSGWVRRKFFERKLRVYTVRDGGKGSSLKEMRWVLTYCHTGQLSCKPSWSLILWSMFFWDKKERKTMNNSSWTNGRLVRMSKA